MLKVAAFVTIYIECLAHIAGIVTLFDDAKIRIFCDMMKIFFAGWIIIRIFAAKIVEI